MNRKIFLQSDKIGVSAKIVYQLAVEHNRNPERIYKTQALTLNPLKPNSGLSGEHGLYGSDEWWSNIISGIITVRYVSGVITEMYHAGMDTIEEDDTMDFNYLDEGGVTRSSSCYANDPSDIALYKPGKRVWLAFADDKLKKQPAKDGGINYLDILLEAAVSL